MQDKEIRQYLTENGTDINNALKTILDRKRKMMKLYEDEKIPLDVVEQIVQDDEILEQMNSDYCSLIADIGYIDLAMVEPIIIDIKDVGETE